MRLFDIDKLLYKFKKITFAVLKYNNWGRGKSLNKYVSLGLSCFARMKLTKHGLKQTNEFGELSCPFDLCVTPLKSMAEILDNDFSDYFGHFEINPQTNHWENKKYWITYNHDDNLSLDKLITRYKKRIENFRNIAKTTQGLKFITMINDLNPNDDTHINSIHKSLKKYCGTDKFKYFVFNFNRKNIQKNEIEQKLDKKIIYTELNWPYENLPVTWWDAKADRYPEARKTLRKFFGVLLKN